VSLSFVLSPGNRNDIVYAQYLLDSHDLRGKMVLADMGYDSADFRRYIIERGGIPIIPNRVTTRIQWDFDERAYSERCLVENLFMKMKNCRLLPPVFIYSRPNKFYLLYTIF